MNRLHLGFSAPMKTYVDISFSHEFLKFPNTPLILKTDSEHINSKTKFPFNNFSQTHTISMSSTCYRFEVVHNIFSD